jgi:predicted amidohydrolase YtcJ
VGQSRREARAGLTGREPSQRIPAPVRYGRPIATSALFAVLGAPAFAAEDCGGADRLLVNGRIVTMDDSTSIAEAAAIRDGRFVAVGRGRDLAACAGPRTVRVDLEGRSVLPGLIDVHTHALEWAKGLVRNDVAVGYPAVRTVADLVGRVRERAAVVARGGWIVGSGWDDAKLDEKRYVTRADLDPVSPEHPVYLTHVSDHLAAANSLALREAGITKSTADPPGGLIERSANGEPTGILKDNAMALVAARLPPDPPDLAVRAARVVSERALAVGLTTLHDVNLTPADLGAYQDAERRGWLRARVRLVPGVASVADAERLASQGVHTGFGSDRLKLGGAKMFADGGMGARTIAVYEPLADEPANRGLLIWTSEDMRRAHLALARAGWQLVTHAIGDRALDQVLDSYEATQRELGLEDARFRIVHAGLSTPAIQKRLRALRVGVDGNPPFVYWIGSWFRKYGPERVRWSYPGRSYVDAGIVAGGASDAPVTPLSPWWGVWAAVVRQELETGEILAPDERLSVAETLRLYTRNGAWLGFEENRIGVIAPGALADLVVVDRDVLGVPASELKDVQVLMTFVGGELVFDAARPAAAP